MSEHVAVERRAREFAQLTPAVARAAFGQLIRDANDLPEGPERKLALDFNAHLATALREAKVPIWGPDS